MNERDEGVIAVLAALFVLFSSILNPMTSVVLAVIFLLTLGLYRLVNMKKKKAPGRRRSR